MDNIHNALGGTKRLDLYETGRVDKRVGIEETMRNFKALIDEGKFDHIGLSEVSAATVRKAHAVSYERLFPFCKVECLPKSGRSILSQPLKLRSPRGPTKKRLERSSQLLGNSIFPSSPIRSSTLLLSWFAAAVDPYYTTAPSDEGSSPES